MLNYIRQMRGQLTLPNISAEAWCIYDVDTGGSIVTGKRAEVKRQVASLTKMMTFYTSY